MSLSWTELKTPQKHVFCSKNTGLYCVTLSNFNIFNKFYNIDNIKKIWQRDFKVLIVINIKYFSLNILNLFFINICP